MPKVVKLLCSSSGSEWSCCIPALASLIKSTRPFLGLVSRAKAAKLVRTLVDLFLDMEAGTGEEVNQPSFSSDDRFFSSGHSMPREHRMGKEWKSNLSSTRTRSKDWYCREIRTRKKSLFSRLVSLLCTSIPIDTTKHWHWALNYWKNWRSSMINNCWWKFNFSKAKPTLPWVTLRKHGEFSFETNRTTAFSPLERRWHRPEPRPMEFILRPSFKRVWIYNQVEFRGEEVQQNWSNLFVSKASCMQRKTKTSKQLSPISTKHSKVTIKSIATRVSLHWSTCCYPRWWWICKLLRFALGCCFHWSTLFRPDDVNGLMSVKLALKYSGRDVDAMKAVAQASKKRSLADFQQVHWHDFYRTAISLNVTL